MAGQLTRRAFLAAAACALSACAQSEPAAPEQAPEQAPAVPEESEPAMTQPAPAPAAHAAAKQLPSGHTMPALGFGTWTLRGEVAQNCTYEAIRLGYRLIDTAQYYGNEQEVGAAIARAVGEGICSREELFVTTKVMPSAAARAAASIDESLEMLGLAYIDLMLIHQPGTRDAEVWSALEEGVHAGKLRSIGLSNYYTPEHFDQIAQAASVPVSVLQNENHPFYNNGELKAYIAEKHGTVLESWYPLGGRPGVEKVLSHEAVIAAAEAAGTTAASAVLAWQLQSGYVAIPGSSNPAHIAENLQTATLELGPEALAALDALHGIGRFENW